MTKISATSRSDDEGTDAVIDGNKALLLAKGLALPSKIATLREGKGKQWVANGQAALQINPKGMLIVNADALSEDCVSATTLTEFSNMFQMEGSRVSVDYSNMLTSTLTCQQRKELFDLLQKFREVFDQIRNGNDPSPTNLIEGL